MDNIGMAWAVQEGELGEYRPVYPPTIGAGRPILVLVLGDAVRNGDQPQPQEEKCQRF